MDLLFIRALKYLIKNHYPIIYEHYTRQQDTFFGFIYSNVVMRVFGWLQKF